MQALHAALSVESPWLGGLLRNLSPKRRAAICSVALALLAAPAAAHSAFGIDWGTHNTAGRRAYEQGRYTEADPLYWRSVAIRIKALRLERPELANNVEAIARALGPGRPDAAWSFENLRRLFHDVADYAEAARRQTLPNTLKAKIVRK